MDKDEENINKKINYKSFFSNFKKTFKYAKDGKKYIYLFFTTNIILCGISVIVPIVQAKRTLYLTNSLYDQILSASIYIFIFEILYNSFRFLNRWLYNKFYIHVRKNIQIDLINETLKINQNDLNNNSSGIFIERITSDTDSLTDIYAALVDYILKLITGVGVLISIFFVNKIIFIFYIVFIILTTIYNKIASKYNYKYRKIWKKSREKNIGFISEIVRGAKDIKILDAEESFVNKSKSYIDETNQKAYTYSLKHSLTNFLHGNLMDICDLIIIILLIILLKKELIILSTALIIMNFHYRIIDLSFTIEQIFATIREFDLAAGRIFEIIDNRKFKKEKFGNKSLDKFNGNIKFNNVHFGYEENIDILKGVSFEVKANQTVAFVGSSGAGKSTIFNLISYLYKPQKGIITFDDVDINELDKHSIRSNLSVISQNPYIYNMSIKDNLMVIKDNTTMDEIIKVCKIACLDDFIDSLPNKYDTVIGEGGVTLSGGQKQRLAIARALLLKTEIILFDEATSALDNITQTKIQDAINNMKGEYTILIIAHRITTVMNADIIYVIDDGKIVDKGTHDYLIKNSNKYKELYSQELK